MPAADPPSPPLTVVGADAPNGADADPAQAVDGDGAPAGTDPSSAPSPFQRWAPIAVGAIGVLPIVVATVRAVAGDWVPVGDNAIIAVRSYDVLTRHDPLLGTWTSASLATGTELHNPGPLQFDLMALPVKLLGGRGVPLASGAINAAAVVGTVWAARRRGGPVLAAAAALVSAMLTWLMGSQLVIEPWQPHNTMLPFLCYLVLVWAVTCGDLPALPVAAAVGSFVLQTHLSHGLLVPALGLWALIGLALTLRAGHRSAGAEGAPRPRRVGLWLGGTVLVLLLCWSQPLVQQVGADGPGNLGKLVTNFGTSGKPAGPELGTRVVSGVVATPPWWSRASFHQAWLPPSGDARPEAARLPSTAVAVGSVGLLLVALAAGAWVTHRHRQTAASRAAATAIVALAAGLVTAASVPLGLFGLTPNQFRWLWPITAFVAFALLAVVSARLADRDGGPRTSVVMALATAAALVALGNLPTGPPSPSNTDEQAREVARGLNRQLGVLEGEGPILVRMPEVYNDPFGGAVMAELARRDIPFLVVPEWTPQLGDGRRYTGDNARSVLTFRTTWLPPPPGGRRIAESEGLALYLSPGDDG